MIYTGEYGVAEVVNYNPFNEHVIEEKILKRTVHLTRYKFDLNNKLKT